MLNHGKAWLGQGTGNGRLWTRRWARARELACGRGGSDGVGREQGEGTAVAKVARARQRELR